MPKRVECFSWQSLADEWTRIIREQNEKLIKYGKSISVNLGTTLSAMLIVNDKYMIAHVGDSRIYEISDSVIQLTEDQTYINREIKAGRMTPQEAAVNPKRNMLLQCVGSSREVNPDILYGSINANTVYMLCSDGFRHVITDAEIFESFNPINASDVETMEQNSKYLIGVVKNRNEKDNITVAILKYVN